MDVQEKYKSRMFTEEGYDALHNYTKTLIKEYVKRNITQYPFQLGLVYGMPFFHNHYSTLFKDPSELLGRIQGYMQLLMMSEIEIQHGETTIIFELPRLEEQK